MPLVSKYTISCLKRVKSNLRSSLTEGRFNNLEKLSIKSETLSTLSTDNLITDFTTKKVRQFFFFQEISCDILFDKMGFYAIPFMRSANERKYYIEFMNKMMVLLYFRCSNLDFNTFN